MLWLAVGAILGFFLCFGATAVHRRVGHLTHLPRARRLGYTLRVLAVHAAIGVIASLGAIVHGIVGSPVTLGLVVCWPLVVVASLLAAEYDINQANIMDRVDSRRLQWAVRHVSTPLTLLALAVVAVSPLAVGVATGRGTLIAAWPLVGLAAGMLTSPVEADAEGVRQGEPPADAVNVVVCMVDSLRRDRTSLHGYERNTTPFLEGAREEAYVFDNCVAPGTRSGHSIPSLLTGTYATVHESGGRLGDLRVLSDEFADAGYATAAISGNPHVTVDRLGDRFDWFVRLERGRSYLFGAQRLLRRALAALGLRHLPSHYYFADIEFINDLARGFITDALADDRPFFCYLSYMDIHDPYVREFPNVRAFAADHDTDLARGAWMRDRDGDMTEWYTDRVKNWGYDETVHYTDRHLERFVAFLEDAGVREETAIVVTSDHGELLGDRGYWGHIDVPVGPLVDVPLVIYPPGGDAGGETVTDVVSGAHLPSLVCDVADIDPSTAMRSQWFDPPCLSSLLDGTHDPRYALVDYTAGAVWTKGYAHPVTGRVEHNDSPPDTSVRRQRLLVGDDYTRYLLNDDRRFHRRLDTFLETPLDDDTVPDAVRGEMDARLTALNRFLEPGAEGTVDPYGDVDDPAVRRQLRDLGYL